MLAHYDRLVIDQEPKRVVFISEPYVVYTKAGFTAAADVITSVGAIKREQTLFIAAQSLSLQLKEIIYENNQKLLGVEVWIYKSGSEKTAKYIVEE